MSSGGEFLDPSETGIGKDGERFELSPDGSVRVTYYPEELLNNQFYDTLDVTWEGSAAPLMSSPHGHDARVFWTGARNFRVVSGKAYGRGTIEMDADVDAMTGFIEQTGRRFPLGAARQELDRAYWAYVRTLPPLPPAPKPPRKPIEWRNLIFGTLVASVLVAAVALGAWYWEQQHPPEQPFPVAPKIKPVEID